MPYRIDLHNVSGDGFSQLIELGALDVESLGTGALAALMPDSVSPGQVASALQTSDVVVSPAVGRDAGSVWILSPRPVEAGGLRIIPAHWPPETGALRLIDSPAFGTGLHPTTRLCLEAIQAIVQGTVPEALLDVGTGSGLLALAALQMGVPRATGIDVDQEALQTAAENARLNGMEHRFDLVHGGPDALALRWPLVVANVLAAPLIELAPSVARRVARRGQLVLSGIPSSMEQDVEQAYRHVGMRRLRVESRGGWSLVMLQASW